jgi:hypothetical protein
MVNKLTFAFCLLRQKLMKEVRKIAHNSILFLCDILVFAYQTVSKVILPNRHQKGNILYSLMSFFVGLIERIQFFEKCILCRPLIFKHKHVKQGLILVAGFLFLLSSLEWTVNSSSISPGNENHATIVYDRKSGTLRIHKEKHIISCEQDPFIHFNNRSFLSFDAPLPEPEGHYFVCRYLHFCTFRI